MQISFMTANYVARQINYHMDGGWGQGDKATNDYFKPIKTFGDRFEVYLNDIRNMGFEAIDVWTSIINPAWASDNHIDTANDLLAEYNLPVVSLAGWFGANADEFEAACNLATELNTEILGGSAGVLTKERSLTISILQKYGLKLGIENHPEKTPQEMFDKIRSGGEGTIGACIDTGWFGTQGYDAAKAIEELAPHLMHVHLKDVLQVGTHESCRFGEGIVPLRECVAVLKRIGYEGAISVEHEPDFKDPTDDCIADLQMLKEWLND